MKIRLRSARSGDGSYCGEVVTVMMTGADAVDWFSQPEADGPITVTLGNNTEARVIMMPFPTTPSWKPGDPLRYEPWLMVSSQPGTIKPWREEDISLAPATRFGD